METCGEECIPLCNHCHHMYQYPDDDEFLCDLDDKYIDPTDVCESFECKLLYPKDRGLKLKKIFKR